MNWTSTEKEESKNIISLYSYRMHTNAIVKLLNNHKNLIILIVHLKIVIVMQNVRKNKSCEWNEVLKKVYIPY